MHAAGSAGVRDMSAQCQLQEPSCSGPELLVRAASRADLARLLEIQGVVAANQGGNASLARCGMQNPRSLSELCRQDGVVLLAELAGNVAGFAVLNAQESLIVGLFVRPCYRSRGIGRRLLRTAEQSLRDRKLKEAWLLVEVAAGLRAQLRLRELDWWPVGFADDGRVVMRKQLGTVLRVQGLAGKRCAAPMSC